jgi:hypothetical protein
MPHDNQTRVGFGLVVLLILADSSLSAAQSLSFRQLREACTGGGAGLVEQAYENDSPVTKSPAMLALLREADHEVALTACSMFISASIDQITFFFDKDGFFDKARVICIDRSQFERPGSLGDLVKHKLLTASPDDVATWADMPARGWIASTMLQIFACPEGPVRINGLRRTASAIQRRN